MSNQEQERLKRLRDRQLTARDPLVKQRKFQHDSVIKEKRMRKPFSLTKAWGDIPHVIKAPFYGLLLGCIVVLVLPRLWISTWAVVVAIFVMIVFILFGVTLGNAMDARDEIKDNISR